jgi:hypothetical protein
MRDCIPIFPTKAASSIVRLSIVAFFFFSGRNPLAVVCSTRLENLGPADLNDRVVSIRIVRTASERSALDTLYNDAAFVGGSVCVVVVFKLPVELSDKVITPRCTGLLVAVQVGYGLGFVALRAKISRSAASSFADADG